MSESSSDRVRILSLDGGGTWSVIQVRALTRNDQGAGDEVRGRRAAQAASERPPGAAGDLGDQDRISVPLSIEEDGAVRPAQHPLLGPPPRISPW